LNTFLIAQNEKKAKFAHRRKQSVLKELQTYNYLIWFNLEVKGLTGSNQVKTEQNKTIKQTNKHTTT